MKIRYVLRYNTPSANTHTSPYSHAWEHDDVATKPTILADCNGTAEFWSLGAVTQERIQGVGSSIKRAIRPNEGAGADGYQAGIEERAVEIYIDALPNPERISMMDGLHKRGYGNT